MQNQQLLPDHVAIIMDGNGRWAEQRGLPRQDGHYQGAQTARDIVRHAAHRQIPILTLFGFSCENSNRPQAEVSFLFGLMQQFMEQDVALLSEHQIRVRVIGDRQGLPESLVEGFDNIEERTALNVGTLVNIAINYSGRWDVMQAVRRLLNDAPNLGPEQIRKIDDYAFSRMLALGSLPDPDLLIRTGNVQRISNFLLWNLAYSELFFTSALWPDFNAEQFDRAIDEYQLRERRFGLTSEQIQTTREMSICS
ncbi:MAG: polyprenyl diphosphate synthase [Pseudomonadota bacterium]